MSTIQGMQFVVMYFDTEINLGVSHKPNRWVNYDNIRYTDGCRALHTYINADCLAPQIIMGENDQELLDKMNEMKNNYQNNTWLNNNVYANL